MTKFKNVQIVPEILTGIDYTSDGDYLNFYCDLLPNYKLYIKFHLINQDEFDFEVRNSIPLKYEMDDGDDRDVSILRSFKTLSEAKEYAKDFIIKKAITAITNAPWFHYEGKNK